MLLTPGLSFTVDKTEMRPYNSNDNKIVEVDETESPVKKPAYSHNGGGGASRQIRKYPTIGAENEDNSSHSRQESRSSDSNPRSNAPSLNPQISDVKQFAPNYDDLHGYLE